MIFDEDYAKLRACGGIKQGGVYTDKCFTFDGSSWEEMPPLPKPYSEPPTILSVQVENQGWWISEGHNSFLFDKNQSWQEGPTFPEYGYSNPPNRFCGAQVMNIVIIWTPCF